MNQHNETNINQGPSEMTRVGATLDSSTNHTSTAPQTNKSESEALPLIVWLRGDESYADEFVVDADQTMELLGIKRSRLTQISGKELRVGRIRVDRYIRPMYRMQDILEYRNWTRATATHSRASDAINEAATKLEAHADRLTDRFDIVVQGLVQNIQDLIETENNAMMGVQEERLRSGFDHQSKLFEDIAKIIQAKFESSYEKADLSLLQDQQHFSHQQEALNKIGIQADHVNQLLLDLHTSMKSSQQMQLQFNRDVGKALSLIIEFQKESSQAQTHAFLRLEEELKIIHATKNHERSNEHAATRRRKLKSRSRWNQIER